MAATVSIPQLLAPMGVVDIDAYIRANWAYNIFRDGSWASVLGAGGPWLGGHATFMALIYFLIPNRQFGPRVFSLIFVSASVGLLYLYSRNLYASVIHDVVKRQVFLLITVCAFVLLPYRLYLATVPLSESVSLFFVLLLLNLLALKRTPYALLIITVCIAQTIRFEFWYIVPVMWALIWLDESLETKSKAFFMSCLILYPLSWIFVNYLTTGNPLFFLIQKIAAAQEGPPQTPYNTLAPAVLIWIKELGDIVGATGLVAAAVGIYKIAPLLWRRCKPLILIPAVCFFALVLQIFLGTMEWQPHRYLHSVVAGTFSFMGIGLYVLWVKLISLPRLPAAIVTLFVVVVFLTDTQYAQQYKFPAQMDYFSNRQAAEVIDYLNQADYANSVYYVSVGDGDDWYPQVKYSYNGQLHELRATREIPQKILDLYETGALIVLNKRQTSRKILLSSESLHKVFENSTMLVIRR